jgi:hypothetical protein
MLKGNYKVSPWIWRAFDGGYRFSHTITPLSIITAALLSHLVYTSWFGYRNALGVLNIFHQPAVAVPMSYALPDLGFATGLLIRATNGLAELDLIPDYKICDAITRETYFEGAAKCVEVAKEAQIQVESSSVLRYPQEENIRDFCRTICMASASVKSEYIEQLRNDVVHMNFVFEVIDVKAAIAPATGYSIAQLPKDPFLDNHIDIVSNLC